MNCIYELTHHAIWGLVIFSLEIFLSISNYFCSYLSKKFAYTKGYCIIIEHDIEIF